MDNKLEGYFKSILKQDEVLALQGLKEAQPDANWTAEKYIKLEYPNRYKKIIAKTSPNEQAYTKKLDNIDKKALKALKINQPAANWTAEKYIKAQYPEKAALVEQQFEEQKDTNIKYRDILFRNKLDDEDRNILDSLQEQDPTWTAEKYLKMSDAIEYTKTIEDIRTYNKYEKHIAQEQEYKTIKDNIDNLDNENYIDEDEDEYIEDEDDNN